ncbi:MAG: type IV secretory system conjugative DNA transfer family protein [Ruminococcus sp.]|nr:type IV secretory system conjugative DNA transfer family protein [Oscillospiraceae bacterium]MBQ6945841.1 type IV secretory system conjugative DNA transfer family protein [Ruminococcus sp.]
MGKAKVAQPRKISKSTIIIYAAIAVVILVLCWILGAAMDYSLKPDGSVDINLLGDAFNKVTANPDLIFAALKKEDSYAPKMLFMGACVVGIYALYKYTEEKKRLHRRGVEHGSAKWGDAKEMKSLADPDKPEFRPISKDGKKVFDEKGNFVGVIVDNNILLTEEVFLSLNARHHLLNLNVLIIGGSGSGKTRFFAKPNIMQLNTSYVITDPKGEILQSTGQMLLQAGYKLKVFNLIEMQHSNNYNPFAYVYDHNGQVSEDNIKKMVDVLFKNTKGEGEKDDFWSQKGQTMLEAIVFLLFEESTYNAEYDANGDIIPETRDTSHLNFFSVTEKMRKLQYPPRGGQLPDGFFLDREPDETEEAFRARQAAAFLCPLDKDFIELEKRRGETLAGRLYKEVRNAPEETGQSFLSSANVRTFMFNLTNLQNLTCCDNIHLETLGDEKTALFIIISATNSTYNFLAAMMYTQMFDTLSNRANFKYGGVLPVHVRCIMDEFANIGQIPDFDKVIAFVRSMGMSLNVIIQNLAQLKAKYEKTWEVITGNCDSLLFLGGKEESTLKSISESLGKETIDIRGQNRTKGKQSSTSENNSIMGRELMQPNELSTMPISDCVLMIRSHNPFYCSKFPIEKHPNFKFLEDFDKKNAFDVSTIHAVSVTELEEQNRQKQPVEVDTCITNPVDETEINAGKIDAVFVREEVEVTATPIELETYEDAELYAELPISDGIFEEYIDNSPKFGEVSDLEAFELGEPIRERKEVEEDETDSAVMLSLSGDEEMHEEPLETHYTDPEGTVQHIEGLGDDGEIPEAFIEAEEFFAEAIEGFASMTEDDYGLSLDDMM